MGEGGVGGKDASFDQLRAAAVMAACVISNENQTQVDQVEVKVFINFAVYVQVCGQISLQMTNSSCNLR